MATVIIHDVDDAAVDRLRRRAEARGGSLEAEVRAFIEESRSTTEENRRALAVAAAADLRAYRDAVYAKYGPMPDSLRMLREERDAW